MKRSLLARSQRYLLWLGVLPLLLALVSYRTSYEHIESVRETLSTNDFLQRLIELLSTLKDAETGQRGYLLTGQPAYLAPYTSAEESIPSQLSRIDSLAQSHGLQQQQVSKLHWLVEAKMAELRLTIHLQQQSEPAAALAEVRTGRGQAYMSELRDLINQIVKKQRADFERKLNDQRRSQQVLEAVLAIGVGLGFLLLFLAFRFGTLYARERERAEQEVQRTNASLELRVQERTLELETRTKELEAKKAELERSNEDLLQFAYISSHDLQEPLRTIASYVGLLAKRYSGQLDERANEYIQFAVEGAGRMQNLINDLLRYARAGTQPPETKQVPAGRIVQTALNNLRAAIVASKAAVHVHDLPVIFADETKLTQVVQNLIANAIKFQKPGLSPEVTVQASYESHEWVFSISDNGIGFDEKYTDRIFQVFQRLHGVGKYPGTGIGLAICRRILEHHGGRLWARSELGVGSTFFFSIPGPRDPPLSAETVPGQVTDSK